MEFTLLEMTDVLKIAFRVDEMALLFAALTTAWTTSGSSNGARNREPRSTAFASVNSSGAFSG